MGAMKRSARKKAKTASDISIDFLAGLYRSHSCYADRLSESELDYIHVETALEKTIKDWLSRKKKDVVLVGNPGDGKTHLLRTLSEVIRKARAIVELDATASEYENILKQWKTARRTKRPFCLAINQGPLNHLLEQSGTWAVMKQVREQLAGQIYYDKAPPRATDVLVVDLNLQSVLTRNKVEACLGNLLRKSHFDALPDVYKDDGHDAAINRKALSHREVQERLFQLLEMIGHSGVHITMRDLQGFLSFLLFGGLSGGDLIKLEPHFENRYFNLCFEGEGELFDAIRGVFDPIRVTHPIIDEHLWEHTGVYEGWLFGRPPLTPDHYDDAEEQFRALKRQYYFEHEEGDALVRQIEQDDRDFLDLVRSDEENAERHLNRVLEAINSFYCPSLTEDGEALRLWASQQYDGHASRVLVSCYRVARQRFRLQLPKVAPSLENAIDFQADHVLLRYVDSSQPVGLRIGRGLWRALMLAGRGMPFALRSKEYAQSLESFLTEVRRSGGLDSRLQTVYLYDLDRRECRPYKVDRKSRQYISI